jgi:hypothetical protein
MRTIFLLDPTQVITCVENTKGNSVRSTPDIQQGIEKEIAEYKQNRTYVLYIPGFNVHLKQVMNTFIPKPELKIMIDAAGLLLSGSFIKTLKQEMPTVSEQSSTSSAASASASFVGPGRTTNS